MSNFYEKSKSISYDVPKMYYTPNETKEYSEDTIKLIFYPIGFEYSSDKIVGMRRMFDGKYTVKYIIYKKIELRNHQFGYLYVMDTLVDEFFELYLNTKRYKG